MTDHQEKREGMRWRDGGRVKKTKNQRQGRGKKRKCDRIKRERGCASDMYSLHAS